MTIQTQDEAAREARIVYFRSRSDMIEEKAQEQARASKSDPFTYSRVRSHFLAGVVVDPDDYFVEWGREIRTTTLGGRQVEFAVHSSSRVTPRGTGYCCERDR